MKFMTKIVFAVLWMVLLVAPDQRRSQGEGPVQEDLRARLHRRRKRQEDVQVHRERSQPRSGKINQDC